MGLEPRSSDPHLGIPKVRVREYHGQGPAAHTIHLPISWGGEEQWEETHGGVGQQPFINGQRSISIILQLVQPIWSIVAEI